jgi:hypothetical protein
MTSCAGTWRAWQVDERAPSRQGPAAQRIARSVGFDDLRGRARPARRASLVGMVIGEVQVEVHTADDDTFQRR